MKKTLAKIAAGSATFLASAYPVFAQAIDVVPPAPAPTVADVSFIGIITTAIRIIIIGAFIIAFIVLLIGGIRWMTAGGDPKGVEGARNMVTAALIGLVIVLASLAIIRLIEFLFGVTIISGTITLPSIPPGGPSVP